MVCKKCRKTDDLSYCYVSNAAIWYEVHIGAPKSAPRPTLRRHPCSGNGYSHLKGAIGEWLGRSRLQGLERLAADQLILETRRSAAGGTWDQLIIN